MRIGFFPRLPMSFIYGGGEVQLEKTMEHLRLLGHDAVLVDPGNRAGGFDLFHFFGLPDPALVRAAVRRAPSVLSPIYYDLSRIEPAKVRLLRRVPFTVYRALGKAMLAQSALLPNSNAECRQMERHWGISPDRMCVVRNGVDRKAVGGSPESFLRRFGLPSGERFVLSAHRIERRKNTLLLIEAAARVGCPLIIAGPASASAEEAAYVERVRARIGAAAGCVRWVGPLDREVLLDGYAAAHVHALPSVLETPGLASLEAGLNGANLVVGDCEPVREYFDGIADFCDGSVESLRASLERALARKRDEMGQSARISKEYTWERAAQATEEAYIHVLRDRA